MKKSNVVSIEKVAHIQKYGHEVSYNLFTGEIHSHGVYDNQTGYEYFILAGERVYVHHFIAVAGGLDIAGKVVHKLDGNRTNNGFLNLEVLTHSEVMKRASKRGAFNNEKSPRFTEQEVYEILEAQEKGANDYELGRKYGRDHMVFAKIRWGKSYKDVIAKRNRQLELLDLLGLPAYYLDGIRKMIKNGASDDLIAEISGVGKAVIKQFR
jgi:hypothetical protein